MESIKLPGAKVSKQVSFGASSQVPYILYSTLKIKNNPASQMDWVAPSKNYMPKVGFQSHLWCHFIASLQSHWSILYIRKICFEAIQSTTLMALKICKLWTRKPPFIDWTLDKKNQRFYPNRKATVIFIEWMWIANMPQLNWNRKVVCVLSGDSFLIYFNIQEL